MKPIVIVGGGLAGLTLGIGLRQAGVPVTIHEAAHYPRHRVCGEFVSGRGQSVLARLGLSDALRQAGQQSAHTVFFQWGRSVRLKRNLPSPAWCLSRFALDDLLARTFRNLGGELHEGSRWTLPGDSEGIVRASGRKIEAVVDGWRLFGLKCHARNVRLEADLEMHFQSSGYVGLCRLAEGVVNVCGLFRARHPEPDLGVRWPDWLRGAPDSPLHQRLAIAEFIPESFSSVAGISLRPRRATSQSDCRIGDALTMIPPLTGNGMSMAFESAEMGREPLEAYSRGACDWSEARRRLALRCDRAFARRLAWAGLLQRALLHRAGGGVLSSGARFNSPAWNALFALTR